MRTGELVEDPNLLLWINYTDLEHDIQLDVKI